MLATFGRYLGNRVVTAVLVVGSVGAGIYFWRNPDQLAVAWNTVKYALVWIGVVGALPWATFFIPRWVMKHDSNAASHSSKVSTDRKSKPLQFKIFCSSHSTLRTRHHQPEHPLRGHGA